MSENVDNFYAWLLLVLVPHAIVQVAVLRALLNIENTRPAVISRLPFRQVDWLTGGLIASIALALGGRVFGLSRAERRLFRTFFATYALSIVAVVGYVNAS